MQQRPTFQEMVNTWNKYLLKEKHNKEKENKIKNLLDGQNFIIFFKKGDKIFGAPEEGRIVYASLMNPTDEEMPPGWEKDASFPAFDLISSLAGNPIETLFTHKDLPNIEVIDKAAAAQHLMKCPDAGNVDVVPQGGKPIGVIDLKDKAK